MTCRATRTAVASLVLALSSVLLPLASMAADLQARVLNTKGEFVEQAVITARPLAGLLAAAAPGEAVIDQVNKEFIPPVTAVR